MVDTTKQAITGEWQQISEGDCTIQSESPTAIYEVAVTAVLPTDASIRLSLGKATTFAYKTPVWLRLQEKGNSSLERIVNIIK